MRYVKLRMYDTERKGWVMPPSHQEASSMPLVEAFGEVGKYPKILILGEGTGRFILQESTLQYDKNGKEIFEGDIVSLPSYGQRKIVEWGFSSADGEAIGYEKFDLEDAEIIGNIFDNPELMKEKEAERR